MSEHNNEHKEHERLTSEALSVKLENSASARNWIIRGVVIFLVLIFFGGMALGANDLLTRDGTLPPDAALDDTITNPPEGVPVVYDYIQASIADAVARKPRLQLETRFEFGNDKDHGSDRYKYVETIELAGADAEELARLKSELTYLAPSLCEYLHTAILARDADGAGSKLWDDEENGLVLPEKPQEASPTRRTQFGEDFSKLLWSAQADPAGIESASCGFIAYRCTACGKVESEQKDQCPECKAKGTPEKPIMVLFYQPNYTLTLRFPDGSPVVNELFHLSTHEEVLALLGDQLEGIAEVREIQLALRNARIEAEIDRTTKEIKALRFKRDVDVSATLRPDPAFSTAREVSVKFTMGESTNFGFTWPAANLSASERTMKTRENSQLTVRYDTPWEQETPQNTTCTWASSDEEICTVDQEGYLQSGKKTGTAVISLTFELGGKTYKSECVVNVKVPVENVKVSRRNLKLDQGATWQLTAKVSPRKATYQEVTWHSENPEIAAVDENGLVTAVAPGEALLYARTVDGYYISKCFVTVRGGAG